MMYQQQLIELDLGRIKVNPLNPRKHQGKAHDQLKASIQEIGMIVPPLVRVLPAGFYETIDREGRVHVARELGQEKIVVLSIGITNDKSALTLLQASNTVRTLVSSPNVGGLLISTVKRRQNRSWQKKQGKKNMRSRL